MYSVGVVCVDRYIRKNNVFLCKVNIYVCVCIYVYIHTHQIINHRSSPDEFLLKRNFLLDVFGVQG